MEIEVIKTSYARWALIYDKTFGLITQLSQRRALDYINNRPGRVLEVGIGTGVSLKHYSDALQITGIDFSEEMLGKALAKVEQMDLDHVDELRQMDARFLDYPDNHFDTVAAMHVLSVVPEPERVMAEITRVCRPGGKVVITNHFAHEKGLLGSVAKLFAPLTSRLGWHSDFEIGTVLQEKGLVLEKRQKTPPLGMMTFLVLGKADQG